MSYAVDRRFERGHPECMSGAHREAERGDAARVDIGTAAQVGKALPKIAQHLSIQRVAVPEPFLRSVTLVRRSAPTEGRHLDAERHEAGPGQNRSVGADE